MTHPAGDTLILHPALEATLTHHPATLAKCILN
eukprot:CAMPEP_0184319064 /NCGR_PEP_ID=MMETSP1049-20130417/106325_1 /TAXON_ID=77928 /ORGANISM="Proteomonas sulcata, Strain CCMP704" /LENGTH=32 /DNA_ID= /DNA_START= /DNA_END= /DNA_ORIENTATION=